MEHRVIIALTACCWAADVSHGQMMYWTDPGVPSVQRANVDGSSVELLVRAGLVNPHDIAVDPTAGWIYWTDRDTGKIQRAGLDGSNVRDIIAVDGSGPHDLALDLTEGKLYWTDRETARIQRANLNGSAIQIVVGAGLVSPRGIDIDPFDRRVYWTDAGTNKVQRATLDGSGVEDLAVVEGGGLRGIAVDPLGGKVYWAAPDIQRIQRANLDGSEAEDIIVPEAQALSPRRLAVDPAAGHLYWTDGATGSIRRANLDGSEIVELVTGLVRPRGIALDVIVTVCEGITTRTLPDGYAPGVPLSVSIRVAPNSDAFVYAVEDTAPVGWTVTEISDNGLLDRVNGKIKWGPFFDTQPRELMYVATPPDSARGPQCFGFGNISIDGVDQPVCSQCISPCPPHPADQDADFLLEISDVTAYGAAWRRGDDWPTGPVPIPISFVTRAGFLWRAGEQYCCDVSNVLPPPSNWVVDCPVGPLAGASNERGARRVARASIADRLFNRGGYVAGEPIETSISVAPDATAFAYAVVDAPPAGWAVSQISDGGEFDRVNGKVKWGPFFDTEPRELRYTATPPEGETGCRSFEGIVSIDGLDAPIVDGRMGSLGDADCDGDVDLSDHLALLACFNEAGIEPARCAVFDADGNRKIDLADLIAFQAAFTGTR